MKVRLKCSGDAAKRDRLFKITAGCVFIAVLIAAAGFNLTKDKTADAGEAQPSVAEIKEEPKENEGWKDAGENPLRENTDTAIDAKIRDYYARKTSANSFAEGYNNIRVYLKNARYEDTYVAFVEYTLKIKDIYTEVPGMETFYLEKEGEDWELISGTSGSGIAQEADEVAEHGDVQQLMADVQQDYADALASDALLAEALADLEQATAAQ